MASDPGDATNTAPPRAPRWVKVLVLIVAAAIVAFVAMAALGGGQHRPNRHSGSPPERQLVSAPLTAGLDTVRMQR